MEGIDLSDVILPILIALMTYTSIALMEIRRNVRDLHKWHAPDDRGRQNWKVPDLAGLIARIDTLITIMERDHKGKG